MYLYIKYKTTYSLDYITVYNQRLGTIYTSTKSKLNFNLAKSFIFFIKPDDDVWLTSKLVASSGYKFIYC